MSTWIRRAALATVVATVALFAGCGDSSRSAPKNVIIMISDGCGFNQVAAADLFQYGRVGAQVYESFPVQLSASTYSASGHGYSPESFWSDFDYPKQRPTDSAAAATALSTGTKTYNGRLCMDTTGVALKTVLQRADELGKATGTVTSVQFCHATPAGFAAHNISRGHYEEIAKEMLLQSGMDVIMGCGHPLFDADGRPNETPNYRYVGGEGLWNGLVAGAVQTDSGTVSDANGDGTPDAWTLLQTRDEIVALATGDTPTRVVAVPQVWETLQEKRSGAAEQVAPFQGPRIENMPTLPQMTRAALNVLDNDPDGFFLMIEGGAIDWACHSNLIHRLIEEQVGFNRAVEAVVQWVETNSSWDETLVIITADHETGYLLGPGSGPGEDGAAPTYAPLENRGQGQVPGFQWNSGGHTNSLVPVYAKGAGHALLIDAATGTDPVRGRYMDNTDIPNTVFALWQTAGSASN